MTQQRLQDGVEGVLSDALNNTAKEPELAKLHQLLEASRERLHQPMRVAIVGRIKAGKSTLMNALLGEDIVAMGATELTFNVNWFQHGDPASLRVHYKDQTHAPEYRSPAELTALTARNAHDREYLRSIAYIQVTHPNSLLQSFNLIDTPGLGSFYEEDSENTRLLLGFTDEDVARETSIYAGQADAMVYLFNKAIAKSDEDTVNAFQRNMGGAMSAINTVGVLTKVDTYWSGDEDPTEMGREVVEQFQKDFSQVRNMFYTIEPICGQVGFGAQTLLPDEEQAIGQLASLAPVDLLRLLSNAVRFTEKEYAEQPAIPVAAQRRRLYDRLGQYGVWIACQYLRTRADADSASLRTFLLEQSGVGRVRELICSHFGNRAYLIKLSTVINDLLPFCFKEQRRVSGSPLQIVNKIANDMDMIATREHAFQELRILREVYEGRLPMSPAELDEIARVTGEEGVSCGERLGLGENATVREMIRVAEDRTRAWRIRQSDFAVDGQVQAAARVLTHSYEGILYHLHEAERHLYL